MARSRSTDYGRRAGNEKATYNDRTQSHFRWDPARAEYPAFLQFAILDGRTRALSGTATG